MTTRREFLEKAFASAALAGIAERFADAALVDVPGPQGEIDVFVTDPTRRHAQASALRWAAVSGAPSRSAIVINPAEKAQPILGFGAALTDAACYVLSQMPESRRGS